MTFYVRQDKRAGWVIIRVNGHYEQHAHIKSMAGCQQLLRLIEMGLEPKSDWLQQSARRLLTDDEYQMLKRTKDRYVNRGRR